MAGLNPKLKAQAEGLLPSVEDLEAWNKLGQKDRELVWSYILEYGSPEIKKDFGLDKWNPDEWRRMHPDIYGGEGQVTGPPTGRPQSFGQGFMRGALSSASVGLLGPGRNIRETVPWAGKYLPSYVVPGEKFENVPLGSAAGLGNLAGNLAGFIVPGTAGVKLAKAAKFLPGALQLARGIRGGKALHPLLERQIISAAGWGPAGAIHQANLQSREDPRWAGMTLGGKAKELVKGFGLGQAASLILPGGDISHARGATGEIARAIHDVLDQPGAASKLIRQLRTLSQGGSGNLPEAMRSLKTPIQVDEFFDRPMLQRILQELPRARQFPKRFYFMGINTPLTGTERVKWGAAFQGAGRTARAARPAQARTTAAPTPTAPAAASAPTAAQGPIPTPPPPQGPRPQPAAAPQPRPAAPQVTATPQQAVVQAAARVRPKRARPQAAPAAPQPQPASIIPPNEAGVPALEQELARLKALLDKLESGQATGKDLTEAANVVAAKAKGKGGSRKARPKVSTMEAPTKSELYGKPEEQTAVLGQAFGPPTAPAAPTQLKLWDTFTYKNKSFKIVEDPATTGENFRAEIVTGPGVGRIATIPKSLIQKPATVAPKVPKAPTGRRVAAPKKAAGPSLMDTTPLPSLLAERVIGTMTRPSAKRPYQILKDLGTHWRTLRFSHKTKKWEIGRLRKMEGDVYSPKGEAAPAVEVRGRPAEAVQEAPRQAEPEVGEWSYSAEDIERAKAYGLTDEQAKGLTELTPPATRTDRTISPRENPHVLSPDEMEKGWEEYGHNLTWLKVGEKGDFKVSHSQMMPERGLTGAKAAVSVEKRGTITKIENNRVHVVFGDPERPGNPTVTFPIFGVSSQGKVYVNGNIAPPGTWTRSRNARTIVAGGDLSQPEHLGFGEMIVSPKRVFYHPDEAKRLKEAGEAIVRDYGIPDQNVILPFAEGSKHKGSIKFWKVVGEQERDTIVKQLRAKYPFMYWWAPPGGRQGAEFNGVLKAGLNIPTAKRFREKFSARYGMEIVGSASTRLPHTIQGREVQVGSKMRLTVVGADGKAHELPGIYVVHGFLSIPARFHDKMGAKVAVYLKRWEFHEVPQRAGEHQRPQWKPVPKTLNIKPLSEDVLRFADTHERAIPPREAAELRYKNQLGEMIAEDAKPPKANKGYSIIDEEE